MIGWITTIVAVLLVPVAWFAGCLNVHRKDEREMALARNAASSALNAIDWETVAFSAQTEVLELERTLEAALTSNSELRIERDALKLQLDTAKERLWEVGKQWAELAMEKEAAAHRRELEERKKEQTVQPEQQYTLKTPKIAPTRPKQGRPPYTVPKDASNGGKPL